MEKPANQTRGARGCDPVEIPLKQWTVEESLRAGVSAKAIHCRLERGGYAKLEIRRINKRVIMVRI